MIMGGGGGGTFTINRRRENVTTSLSNTIKSTYIQSYQSQISLLH